MRCSAQQHASSLFSVEEDSTGSQVLVENFLHRLLETLSYLLTGTVFHHILYSLQQFSSTFCTLWMTCNCWAYEFLREIFSANLLRRPRPDYRL